MFLINHGAASVHLLQTSNHVVFYFQKINYSFNDDDEESDGVVELYDNEAVLEKSIHMEKIDDESDGGEISDPVPTPQKAKAPPKRARKKLSDDSEEELDSVSIFSNSIVIMVITLFPYFRKRKEFWATPIPTINLCLSLIY